MPWTSLGDTGSAQPRLCLPPPQGRPPAPAPGLQRTEIKVVHATGLGGCRSAGPAPVLGALVEFVGPIGRFLHAPLCGTGDKVKVWKERGPAPAGCQHAQATVGPPETAWAAPTGGAALHTSWTGHALPATLTKTETGGDTAAQGDHIANKISQ